MDKELKTRWLEALESGKYKQGKQRLAGGGYYCCLGVLRKIEPSIERQRDSELLATNDVRKLGIGRQMTLARMNDGGKTFKQIAAWIRANL